MIRHRTACAAAGVIAMTILGASTKADEAPPRRQARTGVEVRAFGSLMRIMHEGKAPAAASLADWTPSGTLVAVGALSDLRGEITAVNGRVYLARPTADGSAATTEESASEELAGLLVVARVDRWIEVPIDRDASFDAMDETIRSLAARAGVDASRPFPFLIEGNFRDLRWHTIDGSRLEPGGGHDDHAKAGIGEQREQGVATLVGFYSDSHQGVFTHRGSRTHVHVVATDPVASGHLDHVTIPAGATLKVPAP